MKDGTISQPNFYSEDLEKYKIKVEKEEQEKRQNTLRLTGNTREIEHLIKSRLSMPANPSQVGFDSTLRQFEPYEKIHGPNVVWKTLAMSPKKNLLNRYLPPLRSSSIKNIEKIEKFVCRPYQQKVNVSIFLYRNH